MTTSAQVLDQARAELGTREKPAGSNRTEFGKEYGMDGVAWCAIFVWCMFRRAGATGLIAKSAYTPTLANWFRNQGRWGSAPRPGALVFYDWPDSVRRIQHVGLVEAVHGDGTITTIEGNTSSGNAGSQSDGDGVWRRRRSTAAVVGYGYPAYTDGQHVEPAPAVDTGVVRGLQAAVRVKVDGAWGPNTDAALTLLRASAYLNRREDVRRLQEVVGTKVDGAWGPNSAAAEDRTVAAVQGALGGLTTDGAWGPKTEARFQDARSRFFRG